MKNGLFSCSLLLMIWGCSKEIEHNSNIGGGLQRQPIDTMVVKTINYISEGWKAYPYAGGPGEDSLYWCWSPAFDSLADFLPQNIVSVFINSNGYQVKVFNGFNVETGYYYLPGNATSKPKAISIWWIQKQPGTTPPADSVYINYHPLK